MVNSANFHFNLPSRDVDDIVDINLISDNFRTIDDVMVAKEEGKGLSSNDYTDEDAKIVKDISKIVEEGVLQKQDKFADLTETDDFRILKSNKGIKIQYVSGDDERRDSYVKLLDAFFEIFGASVVIQSVGGVEISGNNSSDDKDNINVAGNRIRNLAEPIFDADAVNKAYMDKSVGDIEAALDEIISIQQGFMGGEGE